MSRNADYVPAEESPLRRALLVVLPVLIAVIVVGMTPVFDRTTVTDKSDQKAVALGLPWPWLHQDQTRLEPVFPIRVGLDAVQESPVTIQWPGLAADLGAVLAVELLVIGGVVLVRRRRERDVFG
ncbi:hypothetical protein [Nocardioides marmorisolisilvae]|uniref:Uncharacterized protein n=1 Tax=Nocardioides marmorisolisilvae TaxID=1542737 RepID=A0A3N0DWA5_9ACTN|nr:hypothetical protein [Nocardioides marmorisolisilvae]RNL79776.1 hypothetical protein EFL95_12545 [Nocardioides marmorisolisilvae]